MALGTILGVPLGIVAGRALWDLFAHELYAIAQGTVPALSVALVAVGAVMLANALADVPAVIARTPTAAGPRAERE